jgi:hypothetical protein
MVSDLYGISLVYWLTFPIEYHLACHGLLSVPVGGGSLVL